MLRYDRQLALV